MAWPGRSTVRVSAATSLATNGLAIGVRLWWRGKPLVGPASNGPAPFMNHPVMWPAKEREVGKRAVTTSRPPCEVMAVAPDLRAATTRPNAVAVARFEGATSRRRESSGCVVELAVELASTHQAHQCRIARVALHGFGGHGSTAFQFARIRARDTGKGVEVGPNDELRAWARAGGAAIRSLAA